MWATDCGVFQSASFFNMPDEEKFRIRNIPGPHPQRGWSCVGAERTAKLREEQQNDGRIDLTDERVCSYHNHIRKCLLGTNCLRNTSTQDPSRTDSTPTAGQTKSTSPASKPSSPKATPSSRKRVCRSCTRWNSAWASTRTRW